MNSNYILESFLDRNYKEWSNGSISLLIMFDDHNDPHCHIFHPEKDGLHMVVVEKINNRNIFVLPHTGDLTNKEEKMYRKCRVLIPRSIDTRRGNSEISDSEVRFDFIVQDKPEFARNVISVFNMKKNRYPSWKDMLSFWWSISRDFNRYDLEYNYTINGKIGG